MSRPLTRRRVLCAGGALTAAVLTSACTGRPPPSTPSRAPPTSPDPLLAVLSERADLLRRYDAVGAVHPDLLIRLQPLRAQTEQQVTALRLALALPPTTAPTAPGSPSSAGPPATSGPPAASGPPPGAGATSGVPADAAAALAGLRAAVHASGDSAGALCVRTTPERAPLVGSLAAAAACHELVLE